MTPKVKDIVVKTYFCSAIYIKQLTFQVSILDMNQDEFISLSSRLAFADAADAADDSQEILEQFHGMLDSCGLAMESYGIHGQRKGADSIIQGMVNNHESSIYCSRMFMDPWSFSEK